PGYVLSRHTPPTPSDFSSRIQSSMPAWRSACTIARPVKPAPMIATWTWSPFIACTPLLRDRGGLAGEPAREWGRVAGEPVAEVRLGRDRGDGLVALHRAQDASRDLLRPVVAPRVEVGELLLAPCGAGAAHRAAARDRGVHHAGADRRHA